MATIRDHRKRADVEIPRGTYAQAKITELGLVATTVTPSVLQRVRAVPANPSASSAGTTAVVRDHRRSRSFSRSIPGSRRSTDTLTRPAGGSIGDSSPSDPTQQSTVNAVPGQPPGFGLTISWIGDEDLAIVAFVSASDPYGIGVSGVTDADTFELVNAVGNATFSQETDHAGVASLVTIVAAGAAVTAAAFGAPELAPLIAGAGDQIAKQFPEQKHNAKSRDVFGQIAGSSEFARQEGGLLVCSPNAQGIFQSGDSDHKERWTKSHHDRSDDHRPDHIFSGFFLQRDHQRRMIDGDGDLIITPWDHCFEDNVGVYRVSFLLRRGDRPPVS